MSKASTDPSLDNRLEEWKAARGLLKDFDDRIGDLRKYGFTVVTALLTINSFLLPSSIGGKDSLTDQVKLAAIGSMMLLIVALQFVERNYRLFQDAAATRARILEISMNFELTEKISDRYRKYEMSHAHLVYFFFLVAVYGVGLAVISQTLPLSLEGFVTMGILVSLSILSIAAAVMKAKPAVKKTRPSFQMEISHFIRMSREAISEGTPIEPELERVARNLESSLERSASEPKSETVFFFAGMSLLTLNSYMLYSIFNMSLFGSLVLVTLVLFFLVASFAIILMSKQRNPTEERVDWTFDRIQCRVGEIINVSMTNLGKTVGYGRGAPAFHIETQDGIRFGSAFKWPSQNKQLPLTEDEKEDPEKVWLERWDTHVWQWDTKDAPPGVYRVVSYVKDKQNDNQTVPDSRLPPITIVPSRIKIKVVTTDEQLHLCEIAGAPEQFFRKDGSEYVSCITHKRTLRDCLVADTVLNKKLGIREMIVEDNPG